MKKLMIILLVVMLSLGLSGVVYAGDQTIEVKIDTAVSITAEAGALTDNSITSAGDWTDISKTIIIGANCPYNVVVKFASNAYPDGETTPDVYMTATTSPYTDLGEAFALGYNSGTGAATSTDATMSENTAITSSDVIFVSCPTDVEDGSDTLGIKYTQTIAMSDPSYHTTGTQLLYQIKLTWTASADIS
jgi:hypothetical protein